MVVWAGDNVSACDKSMEERVAEMRAQYAAMSGGDKQMGALAALPDGADASMVCLIS
jgi:hypothetical protein